MPYRKIIHAIACVGMGLMGWASPAAALETSAGEVKIDRIMRGLNEPWSLGFLPDGGFLVTERGGRLTHVKDGVAQSVKGLPKIRHIGQGGLMDVLVPRDFAKSRRIFLTIAGPVGNASGTAIVRAKLSKDGGTLNNPTTIFAMLPASEAAEHFGGRLVEGPNGHLFLTIGDRGVREQAQDLGTHAGSVIRINPDGSIPTGNPFQGRSDALPEIWSFGHRNPQGAAFDASGQLWVHEHGARGGDEVNKIRKGANYGWPVIAYGRNYSGTKIGIGTHKAGMEQPVKYWDPSIAPSGFMIYSGALWPEWKGHFFIGSLKFDYIAILDPQRNMAEEPLQSRQTGRVRDIREAPDGSIWFLSVDDGAIYRISPAN